MLENDPLWYKDAVIYELHVRAFHDSVGDGIGDFKGLTQKLDYLQDLGVTAVWLLPFYPSPLKDDGYDIADYTSINPDYGSLRDFKGFLKEAHNRGIRVITELVINHTSDQHPWFKRARRAAPGSSHRDFYVWSDTPDKYKEARIIFQDFENSNWTFDSVANAYFWHRFYHHQPDLNYDNPDVWDAVFPLLDFWMEMGVDGLRLDAIPYLYQREGTNCENLPETHNFLKELRKHVDEKFVNRMLLAEANQWPEDSVAYFGDGDECHMAFHFPVMPRMFMAIHMEDRFPIIDIMDQTPSIPENCQWSMFLRNHDELTLEMVTDEERDYMYRAYANDPRARINLGIRRRLAPLLGNNRRRIELMNALLFALPGTPVIYYGEEIGMGDNIYLGDRNSVRTPMQWGPDRNAGFSRANPQKLYLPIIIDPEYHYEAVNVEAQQNNPNSLLWWMKRLIALRKQYKAFGRGSLQFLHPENRKILAFLRRYENEHILVVANLSRFVQYVELDLSEFQGYLPIELFGRTPFPTIGRLPYLLTLSPHSFYWFRLDPAANTAQWDVGGVLSEAGKPIVVSGEWTDVYSSTPKTKLERILPEYIKHRRWFGGKSRDIKDVTFKQVLPFAYKDVDARITIVQVDFIDGGPEQYFVPMMFAGGDRATQMLEDHSPAVIVKLLTAEGEGVLYDSLADSSFCSALFEFICNGESLELPVGATTLASHKSTLLAKLLKETDHGLSPSLSKGEQSNTSIMFGHSAMMKVFRRLDGGVNPELEIGRFLTESRTFLNIAELLGDMQITRRGQEPIVLAILQKYVPNEGDAWTYTLDELSRYFEHIITQDGDRPKPNLPSASLLELANKEPSELAKKFIGTFLETAHVLGERTGEMHIALASNTDDAGFEPVPFSKLYQRSVYQSMRNLVGKNFQGLKKQLKFLPESIQDSAKRLVGLEAEVLRSFQQTFGNKLTGLRCRCHGDFHLGQVLYTGRDFYIIDFEGEPARTISERRLKRSPLVDVAGMIRSFHYAIHSGLLGQDTEGVRSGGVIRPEDAIIVEDWGKFWYAWVSSRYLKGYLSKVQSEKFLPNSNEEIQMLLDAYLLEKAIYELSYELNHRPNWVGIPLEGIFNLLSI